LLPEFVKGFADVSAPHKAAEKAFPDEQLSHSAAVFVVPLDIKAITVKKDRQEPKCRPHRDKI
jgi:hypothetical protein